MSARRFAPPPAIAVATDGGGLPRGLRWRGRWERVAAIEAVWGVTAGWLEAAGATRRCYRLRTAAGLLCVVHHEPESDVWHLEAILD